MSSETTIPGIDPGSVTPVVIDGEPVVGSGALEVRAPYDGRLLGSVPALGAAEVDRAVAAARRALESEPLPQWRRAEILDRAAALLAERQEDFARCIALEAAKPIRTARVEAQRAVSTFQFSAAAARTLAGEVVPLEASQAGEGKLGFILRVPIGVVGAIAPFNFPLNLVVHKLGPGYRGRVPGRAQAGEPDPLLLHPARALLADVRAAVGLPARRHRRRRRGRQPAGGPPGRRSHHLHRVARGRLGHPRPRAAQARRARARQQRAAHPRARRRLARSDRQGEARRVLPRRPVLHLHAAPVRALLDRRRGRRPADSPRWPSSWSATRSTRPPTSRRSSAPASATGWPPGSARPHPPGRTVVAGGEIGADGVLRPTVVDHATPDMKVCELEVFGPVVAVIRYDDFDDALRMANDTRYGLQAGDLHQRHRQGAARGAHARLRRGPGQRGADLPRRPAALRRPARLAATPGRARRGRCAR
jgi:hypothetical protein